MPRMPKRPRRRAPAWTPTTAQRRAAWLGGILAACGLSPALPPLHPALREEWETGTWAVRAGFVRPVEAPHG